MNKLIAIDLDGTLLRNNKTISDNTIRTLLDCKKADNMIVFATARAPRDISMYIPEKLRNNPVICYNGACIINSGKIIHKQEIIRKNIIEILNYAKKMNKPQICIEINDQLYSNFNVFDFFGDIPHQCEDLYNLDYESAYKVMVCDMNGIPMKFLDELLPACRGYITDNGTLCQIMSSNVSKWNAILYLLNNFNIPASNVISFGDDYNDMDMIKNSGIGVAMENAIDELKSIARHVTYSNNDDGVAKFLEGNKYLYC